MRSLPSLADLAAVKVGASREVRGAPAVADIFSGRARAAQLALVNGAAGADDLDLVILSD